MFSACSNMFTASDKGGMTSGNEPITYTSDFRLKASFTYCIPFNGKGIHLNMPYFVEVRNDSIISYLPYIGRADYVPYGGGKGLDFEEPIQRFDGVYNAKRGCSTYYIEVRTNEDYHVYQLEVFDKNGAVHLDVQSRQRDLIRFEGYKE